MTTSYVDAKKIDKQDRQEKEARKLRLRLVIYFCSTWTNGKQSTQRDMQKSESEDDEQVIPIGNRLMEKEPQIKDDIQDDDNTDVKTETIFIDETSKSDYQSKSDKIDNIVRKYCIEYEKVTLNIYLPTDIECGITANAFFLNYCPKCISDASRFGNIDEKKSFITLAYQK